ncbi:putative protein N(5)-glutamine methyltransferase [Nocardia thailandica]|uniref:putative protein N(5)-glutamine methyltransferase n=1 Tax=Nocardia thailandica TaxID=257275 RepID=UPI0003185B66|nr:putative protein N(5)-glutamine methyltransferase [Nocardia thailandica]
MRSDPPAAVVAALRSAGCVFAEEEAALLTEAAADPAELARLVAERTAGTPLEYLLGWVAFRGRRIAVTPGVFVPRQRTGFLVEQAVAAAAGRDAVRVLDLCCGSGALGVCVTAELRAAGVAVDLVAADIDPVATACARANLAGLGAAVYTGDLFAPLPAALRGTVDLLLANTPYVPSGEIARLPPEARDHEPRVALDGGDDGLGVFRRVAAAAGDWLAPGGSLFVETGTAQTGPAVATLRAAGLDARAVSSDEHYATVVVGTAP